MQAVRAGEEMTPLLLRLESSPCHVLTYHRAWCCALAGLLCDEAGIAHVGVRLRIAEAVAWACRTWGEA